MNKRTFYGGLLVLAVLIAASLRAGGPVLGFRVVSVPGLPVWRTPQEVPAASSRVVTPAEAAAARLQVARQFQRLPDGHVQYLFRFPDGAEVRFRDRPHRPGDRAGRPRVVAFGGTQPAGGEPAATWYTAAEPFGLRGNAVEALRFVSRQEGGFDAVNTWDGARFSWGFIQFAGGRGLPQVLAQIKGRRPDLFRQLFAIYGIELLRDAAGQPLAACVDPARKKVLWGAAAEQAFGDSPLLTAAFIHAGRVPEIKQLQIEAAIEHYARPALSARYAGGLLTRFLRSAKALAMLIDRQVQEGSVARVREAVRQVRSRPGLAAYPARQEALVLQCAVQNARRAGARMAAARLGSIYASGLPGPA